jgi:Ca2+/Na+ antiporter
MLAGNVMDIFIFVYTTLGLGILGALPAIIIGRQLGVKGIMREKPVLVCAIGVIVMLVIRLTSVSKWSVMFQLLICAISVPMGIYKAESWARRNK